MPEYQLPFIIPGATMIANPADYSLGVEKLAKEIESLEIESEDVRLKKQYTLQIMLDDPGALSDAAGIVRLRQVVFVEVSSSSPPPPPPHTQYARNYQPAYSLSLCAKGKRRQANRRR